MTDVRACIFDVVRFSQSVRQELLDERESENVLDLESLIDCSDNKNIVSVHFARKRSDSELLPHPAI